MVEPIVELTDADVDALRADRTHTLYEDDRPRTAPGLFSADQ
jgi:hypothetical protein